MERYDLVCIGCGPAGLRAAVDAASAGRRVAVIERSPHPGGAMVNTGTLPSKALRETALLCSSFRRMPMPGLDFALDRSLSVPRFMARRYLLEQQERDRLEVQLETAGVEIRCGHGSLRDANTVIVTDEHGAETELASDYILVTTGSSPVRPDHVPFDDHRVVDADGVLELDAIPATMLIVGAGVIGCEYASIFAEMGVKVSLVNMRSEILPFLDSECRDHLLARMCDAGIEMFADVHVKSIDTNGDHVRIDSESGASFEGDVLLWAAGRQSNTANLGLEEAGVEMGARGLIEVNDDLCTNIPSIYAAGDCIGFPALASTSRQQGRIAVSHMFDLGFRGHRSAMFPMGLYTIPGVSAVGCTEAEAIEQGVDVVIGRALYRDNPRGRMLGDEEGLLKCTFERATGRLLGASIVGEQATELIHLAQAFMNIDDGMHHLAEACFNYPSLTELYRKAGEDALEQMAQDSRAKAA